MEQPNLNYIKQLSDGDEAFEQKIHAVLKKEFPEEYSEFQKNYAEKKLYKICRECPQTKT